MDIFGHTQLPDFGVPPVSDPVTTYDGTGNLYYENLYGNITGCKVIRSTDNGATWSVSVTSILGTIKTG